MNAPISTDWVLLFLRAVMGIVLIYYGWPKIKNPTSNAADFVEMGFRPGLLWGTLIAIVESFGGLAMLAGAYAELAASLFGFEMITGTFWKLKLRKPFSDYSYDLQLLALCVAIMSFGAGRSSIASLNAGMFLRWDVALGAILAGAVLAGLSHPPSPDSLRHKRLARAVMGPQNTPPRGPLAQTFAWLFGRLPGDRLDDAGAKRRRA
jgi:putative oxidoreductase